VGGQCANVVADAVLATLPRMGTTADEVVERYVTEVGEAARALDRLVTDPTGLDAAGMLAALVDPRLGTLGVPFMADLMAPEGSIYFDAIFGAYHGQAAIRAWLVPAMAEIEFVEFVPKAETVLFDDGEGGTSLDEWQMVANLGGEKLPLSRGVSVRRYRGGPGRTCSGRRLTRCGLPP